MSTVTLLPYQQRVVEERDELRQRISKLSAFIESDSFSSVGLDERLRLRDQYEAMHQYAAILCDRIEAFPTAT